MSKLREKHSKIKNNLTKFNTLGEGQLKEFQITERTSQGKDKSRNDQLKDTPTQGTDKPRKRQVKERPAQGMTNSWNILKIGIS